MAKDEAWSGTRGWAQGTKPYCEIKRDTKWLCRTYSNFIVNTHRKKKLEYGSATEKYSLSPITNSMHSDHYSLNKHWTCAPCHIQTGTRKCLPPNFQQPKGRSKSDEPTPLCRTERLFKDQAGAQQGAQQGAQANSKHQDLQSVPSLHANNPWKVCNMHTGQENVFWEIF